MNLAKPSASIGLLGPILLAMLGLAGSGCGGSKSETDPSAVYTPDPDDAYHPPTPKPAPAKVVPPPAKVTRDEDGGPRPAANGAALALPPPLPPPVNLDEWDENDFYVARATHDPRFLMAIEQRTLRPRRTAEEAQMWTALLRQPAAGDPPVTFAPRGAAAVRPPAGTAKGPSLTHLLTAALGANNTTAAQETLLQIISGDLPVTDRVVAVDGAFAALLAHGSPAGEQAVLQWLVAPPPPLPGQDRLTTDAIQKSALAAVRKYGSVQLRSLLARAVVDDQTPQTQRLLFLPLLKEANPLNLEAQVILYCSEQIDAAQRQAWSKQFARDSAAAVRMQLGLAVKQPGATPPPPDWSSRVAGQLWTPTFGEFLGLQHRALNTLADDPAAIALAATIPTTAMRADLHRTMVRHWHEGPSAFLAAVTMLDGWVEPGAIVSLKAAIREYQRLSPNVSSNLNRPLPAVRHRIDDAALTKIQNDWGAVLRDLLRLSCRRCQLAGLAQAARQAVSGATPSAAAADLPLPAPPDSQITASWSITWPGAAAAQLPGLAGDTLHVQYMRVELQTKPIRLMNFYQRQLKACEKHPLGDGFWLNALTVPAPQRLRSTDVLVTGSNAARLPSADFEQPVTVEVLSVEVAVPNSEETPDQTAGG